jgi:3'(2'), 5'-bisphosphate nucleotidase
MTNTNPQPSELNRDPLLMLAISAAISAARRIMTVYGRADFGVSYKGDDSPLTLADKLAHEAIAEALRETGMPVLSEEGVDIPFETRSRWSKFWMVDPLDGTKEFIKRNDEFTVNIALVEGVRPVLGVILAPVTMELWFATTALGAWFVEAHETLPISSWLPDSESLPFPSSERAYRILTSKSHLSEETEKWIREPGNQHPGQTIVQRGSSLKMCMIAEGNGDIYPRLGPTMEWDTAAGDAILTASGGTIRQYNTHELLMYNKPSLVNPWFIASRPATPEG